MKDLRRTPTRRQVQRAGHRSPPPDPPRCAPAAQRGPTHAWRAWSTAIAGGSSTSRWGGGQLEFVRAGVLDTAVGEMHGQQSVEPQSDDDPLRSAPNAGTEETTEICCRDHSVADIEWLDSTGALPAGHHQDDRLPHRTYRKTLSPIITGRDRTGFGSDGLGPGFTGYRGAYRMTCPSARGGPGSVRWCLLSAPR